MCFIGFRSVAILLVHGSNAILCSGIMATDTWTQAATVGAMSDAASLCATSITSRINNGKLTPVVGVSSDPYCGGKAKPENILPMCSTCPRESRTFARVRLLHVRLPEMSGRTRLCWSCYEQQNYCKGCRDPSCHIPIEKIASKTMRKITHCEPRAPLTFLSLAACQLCGSTLAASTAACVRRVSARLL